jgi:hypothetical protein
MRPPLWRKLANTIFIVDRRTPRRATGRSSRVRERAEGRSMEKV